ncbi:MAG: glycoside hydrolase family 9 protein [Candidatus Kapabacteria bacterium]|jgi:endoglucanase|nr:glycoside hydrolase family 9 protein [Candidatus Kapabacteria bacterium]
MKSRIIYTVQTALLHIVWITLIVACSKRETALYSQELAQCRIVVNQLGFYPSAQKIALVQGAVRHEDTLRFGNIADVVDTVRKRVVLRVAMSAPTLDAQSGDTLRALDFSILSDEGTYRVRYGGVESAPFRIGQGVYDNLVRVMLRSYYFQRCGVAVRDTALGIVHGACHREDGVVARADSIYPQGTRIHAVGGWHDAGDYGKYITTTAVTVAELLTLVEEFAKPLPRLFGDNTAIPESNNGVPDVCDEIKVALDWLLRMQRSDGAVMRKLSGAAWSPLIAPDEEQQRRYVYGISTPETAKFAGAMAQAARVLKPYWGRYADTCLRAAKAAWRYLEKHPQMIVDWQVSDDGGSGKYLESEVDREASLLTDTDDRFYAASELFLTTQDSAYFRAARLFLAHPTDTVQFGIVEWKNAAPLAMTNLLRNPAAMPLHADITKRITKHARRIEGRIAASGYRYGNDRIVWGSNKMAAEEGITLLHAYRISYTTGKHRSFLDGAQDQLDFLMGRNPQGLSFVSGIGTRAVEHICHTFARAKHLTGKQMIPGLLAGGANELEQSNIAPKNQGLKSYADDERSYATNENAIDYNASMIALAVRLIAEMERVSYSAERKK